MGREVRRVPVDFDWPIGEVWKGFIHSPEQCERWEEETCTACDGRGYSARYRELHDRWYSNAYFEPWETGSQPYTLDTPEVRAYAERNVTHSPTYYGRGETAIQREAQRLAELFNTRWCHHLDQDDVDALVAAGRLMDFTHTFDPGRKPGWQPKAPPYRPSAEEVNRWSISGFGHDSINAWVAIKAKCEREGAPAECGECHGHGSHERFPGQRAEADAWERTDPPTGEGWQLWETVTEGSPRSPVFATADELAAWMTTDEGARQVGTPNRPSRLTLDQARAFVAEGWSATFYRDAGGVTSGPEHVANAALVAEHEND